MTTLAQIMQLCRLCAVDNQVRFPIFDDQGDVNHILQKITTYVPIKVSREDNLPKTICASCLSKLDMVHEFWNATTKAEYQLETLISHVNVGLQPRIHFDTTEEDSKVSPANSYINERTLFTEDMDFIESKPLLKWQKVEVSPCPVYNEITDAGRNSATDAIKTEHFINFSVDIDDQEAFYPSIKQEEEDHGVEDGVIEIGKESVCKCDNVTSGLINVSTVLDCEQSEQSSNTEVQKNMYKCLECDYKSTWKSDVTKHSWIHSDNRPFKCTSCSYSTAYNSNLHKHIKQKHSKERPFSCDLCKRKFLISKDLKRHKLTHSLVKPFTCDVCQKGFIQNSDLQRHILIHTNVKPHHCDECDFSTIQLSSLRIHKRYKHSNEKPYHCKVCSYRSTQERDLKQHMHVHTKANRI